MPFPHPLKRVRPVRVDRIAAHRQTIPPMPRYERDNIAALHAYVPGEQPTFRETAGTGGVIKLNTNENPLPPSPKVMEAIRTLAPEALRLYPPPDAKWFRAAAAKLHGLTPGQVIATNGGDELLRLLVTVFCEPRRKAGDTAGGIGMTRPSYSLYSVLADIHDTPVTVVDRGHDDFALPDDLAYRWNDAGCRLGFIVNPHAPSGRFESAEMLRPIAEAFDGVLVVDEAYVDFAPGDAIDLIRGDQALSNVVLLRSLSKGYSLAGLRFGYGLGPESIIATLDKARDSYNTDMLSQVAATAAIEDVEYARRSRDLVTRERQRLTDGLRERGYAVFDSQSNFILVTPPDASSGAEAIYQSLKSNRILIRYFSTPGLDDKLRITIGTPEQNDTLLQALDAM